MLELAAFTLGAFIAGLALGAVLGCLATQAVAQEREAAREEERRAAFRNRWGTRPSVIHLNANDTVVH